MPPKKKMKFKKQDKMREQFALNQLALARDAVIKACNLLYGYNITKRQFTILGDLNFTLKANELD